MCRVCRLCNGLAWSSISTSNNALGEKRLSVDTLYGLSADQLEDSELDRDASAYTTTNRSDIADKNGKIYERPPRTQQLLFALKNKTHALVILLKSHHLRQLRFIQQTRYSPTTVLTRRSDTKFYPSVSRNTCTGPKV